MHSSAQLPVLLSMLLLSGLVALLHGFGLEAVLGAFAAGMVIGLAICFGFFVPFYFVVSGIKFDLGALLGSGMAMLLVPVFLALLLVVRGGPAWFIYRADLGPQERLPFGRYATMVVSIVLAITQIAVETAEAIRHPAPLTKLTLNLRRLSRGELTVGEVAARAVADFSARGCEDILRLYNFLRERVAIGEIPGDGKVNVVARGLALGYILDLAEVVSIARHRKLDTRTLARIFRAGLCDKAALDPLLSSDLSTLDEYPATLPEDDRQAFEEAHRLADHVGHPLPSAAAYSDLGSGRLVGHEVAKLSEAPSRRKYDTALRIQAGIRDAFGEHGYEVAR